MKKLNSFIHKNCSNPLFVFFTAILILASLAGMCAFNSLLFGMLALLLFVFLCCLAVVDLTSRRNNYHNDIASMYPDLVKLVQEKSEKYVRELISEDESYSLFLSTNTSTSWITTFHKLLTFIKEDRIKGEPDTFIIAAAMIKAIINDNCITSNYYPTNSTSSAIQDKIVFSANVEFALEVALEMISTPTTYRENSEGEWIEPEIEQDSVKVFIPDGIIKGSTLYRRIINSIVKDYAANCEISVMQLSNMLHLIYLYSRDCRQVIV